MQFDRDIRPIFQQHCAECHGPEEQNGDLRVDQRSSLLRGGNAGGPAIVPGQPDDSFLLLAVSSHAEDIKMPPEGESLTAKQIGKLRGWIEQGAAWPGQMGTESDESTQRSQHWSFRPIPAPQPLNSQGIDERVQKKLAEQGLKMSPRAEDITLLRRVSFVLTGLPPSLAEVEQFTSAASADHAYGEAVDRLLSSPRYGERWAQHWLDIIRWAETVGFETNAERRNAWPYRDWVIDALNADKPYNEFVFEQLAGDTTGTDAALGFLVAGPANLPGQVGRDEEAMRQARQDELDEVIRTVSQGLFGLTIGCARCHNHKFDPILQRDYYSMQAVFAGLSYGERRWRGETNDQWTQQVPAAGLRLQELRQELAELQSLHELRPPVEGTHTEEFDAVEADAIRLVIRNTVNNAPASLYELEAWTSPTAAQASINAALASNGGTPSASSFALANQTRHFDNLVDGSVDRRQAFPWVSSTGGEAWAQIDFANPTKIQRVSWERGNSFPADFTLKARLPTGKWVAIADSLDRMIREDDVRRAEQVKLNDLTAAEIKTLVTTNSKVRAAQRELSRLSAGPKVYAASFTDSPKPTWLLRRGDPMQPAQQVAPAIPAVFGDLKLAKNETEIERRLALAKHLTAQNHPLTARVIVNRIWQHHFGLGLVDTPSDFGAMGSEPTHPELLDALAAGFLADGWSLKELHRKIVMSETFRQSSRPVAASIAVDADSRMLWRFPPRRLEAEAIRDTVLSASGKLNLKMGGPGFNLFKQRGGLSDYKPLEQFESEGWRRMIYAHKIRMQSVDIFGAFDCPDAGQMKPKRTRSITPAQSLSLFNSPFLIRQAKLFAERLQQQEASQPEQIALAFRIAYSRSPSQPEQQQMLAFVQKQGLPQFCRVLMNTSEFIYIQ
ncbi:MAG: PSD1 and planctomycete cytochrome C domain-containing protein [Rubripirellula sp.]